MNSKQIELARKRTELVEKMENLASTAESENRDFTVAEQEKWDNLDAECARITAQIRRIDQAERHKASLQVIQIEDRLASNRQQAWFDPRSKRPLRVFGKGERLTDACESNLLPGGISASDLSLGRYLRGLASGNWDGAEAERELYSASSTSSNTSAGYLVPEVLAAEWIDLARARSVIFRAGAKTVEMTASSLGVAYLKSDPTITTSKGENDEFAESDSTFGLHTLTAKTIGIYCKFSEELWQDAPNLPEIVENVLIRALSGELDRQVLSGSGSQEMSGIVNYPDTNSVDVDGAINWTHFL